MTDSLTKAVDDLKANIAERVATLKGDENWIEIQRLYQALGVLQDLTGQTKTDLIDLLGISSDGPRIGKYEFAGLPALDAAKQYLKKIAPNQKAASLDDIIAALDSGGLKSVNRDELRISLSRSTLEIYKAGDDIYGLVESFPHIKRGTPGRKKAASTLALETIDLEGHDDDAK